VLSNASAVYEDRDSVGLVKDARRAICMSNVEVGESGGECGLVGEVECLLRLREGGVQGAVWLGVEVVGAFSWVGRTSWSVLVEVEVEGGGSWLRRFGK
jgi:hypothetical protein